MKAMNAAAVVLALCSAGCATQRGWRYAADAHASRTRPADGRSVAVLPFRDARPDRNRNALMMYLIPLMPMGWCDYSAPESGNMKLNSAPVWQFRPAEDLAKAAAEELNASGLFKEAFFSYRGSDAGLVLRGTIRSTRYWGKMFTYGLSAYGPMLWFVGFPAGTVHNELAIDLDLQDHASGASLWKKAYDARYNRSPFWFYRMPNDFAYDRLFKGMMRDCVKGIEAVLSQPARPAP